MRLTPLLFALGTLPLMAVPIANASFETATLTTVGTINGSYNNLIAGSTISASGGTLSNWNVSTTAGVNASGGAFAPTVGGNNWTTTWWASNNVGYVQMTAAGSTTLSQSLADTLSNNTTYTLSSLIGRRMFTPTFNYAIELWAGPTLTGATLLGSASNLALASDSSGLDSLVYNSGAGNSLAGQTLHVVLRSTGRGGFSEAFFDNVTLDASASSPEPATWILAGVGLLAVRLGRRAAGRNA